MSEIVAKIRCYAGQGLGVEDIAVKLDIKPTPTTLAFIRSVAFGPREVIGGSDNVVRIR